MNRAVLRNCQTAVHNSYTISHSHQPCINGPVSPHPNQHLTYKRNPKINPNYKSKPIPNPKSTPKPNTNQNLNLLVTLNLM